MLIKTPGGGATETFISLRILIPCHSVRLTTGVLSLPFVNMYPSNINIINNIIRVLCSRCSSLAASLSFSTNYSYYRT